MADLKLLHDFVTYWTGKGYEKGDTHSFWLALLHAYGVENPDQFVQFEYQVQLGSTSYIDAYIPSTRVLIEQKSSDKDLSKGIVQSDGAVLTPYQQARRYDSELPFSMRARWIITCNFKEFWIYDTENAHGEPIKVKLENLEKESHFLELLVKLKDAKLQREMDLSMDAGRIVGQIYDKLIRQYRNPDDPETLRSLNQLCVRLVFLLFAEDAGLFGGKDEFKEYLAKFPATQWRNALINLFRVLDTPEAQRDPYMDDDLKVFKYVNGGLFSDENIEIPQFTDDLKELILQKASADFDWSEISPTIFGGVFESTLNPETRRSGGMHYTSIENIHKVIDPLFLNQLHHEFDDCVSKKDYERFQDKLASLTFFDPACGSGNFLTETYVSLRRLENQVIEKIQGGQAVIGDFANPVKVDIHQFYGIEINDFAVSVATTALWIAELQMLRETHKIAQFSDTPLPLKTYKNIHEGNALRTPWEEVIVPDRLNYIMGNPPFVGYSLQSESQKEDILNIMVDEKGKPYKMAGKVDYVAGWYYKAVQMMAKNPKIRAALVSTNSITQGEQVAGIWKPLYDRFHIHIDYAYPTFRWDSESNLKAHVHCVIIGFSVANMVNLAGNTIAVPRLYQSDGTYKQCTNISPYLIDGRLIFVESTSQPLCKVPELQNGGKPTEGGFLILTEEEKDDLVTKCLDALKYIRPYMMGKDFIDRKPRYCLWMVNASPTDLRKCPPIMQRIESVKNYRLQSPKEATRRKADTPMLFDEVRECTENYVAIPKVSSEKRKYIPMDYLSKDIIPGDKLFMLQSSSLYHFGILTSNVHMAWMRAVCGRLEMRYSYSNTIVYNNFPWPQPNAEQQARIEQTAQAILDARALFPDASLADLYDDNVMPVQLRKAHQANDRAVMEAYGFKIGMSESECVAQLLEMYQTLTRGAAQE